MEAPVKRSWFDVLVDYSPILALLLVWLSVAQKATVRFFIWLFALMALYMLMVIGMELLIRATLPHVNYTIGGI